MTNFQIVEEYMTKQYPNVRYTMRQGNGAIWVTKGVVDMYFIVKNGKIVDIQID